jgi:tetratricopeptide (TPR) repeat protein
MFLVSAARKFNRTRHWPAHWALTALLCSLFLTGAADAAPEQALEREHALQSLTHAETPVRRQAASRLGEVGTMTDTPALVQVLRDADAGARENAERALWRIWERSGDMRIEKLYRTGVAQMKSGELRSSIATLTRVIRLKPGFAEGWNKRATLYFLTGDYGKSLADCAEVIKRNPYHFGALAGYGQIYLKLESYELALEYFNRAIEINPNMDGVRLNIQLLEQLLEQRRRNMV